MTFPLTVGDIGEQVDLKIRQGADFSFVASVTELGLPKDLTGYLVRAHMRKRASDVAPVAVFSCVLDVPATTGVITIGLTSSATAALACGPSLDEAASRYVWDLEIESLGNVVTPLFYGDVRVKAEVTHGS